MRRFRRRRTLSTGQQVAALTERLATDLDGPDGFAAAVALLPLLAIRTADVDPDAPPLVRILDLTHGPAGARALVAVYRARLDILDDLLALQQEPS